MLFHAAIRAPGALLALLLCALIAWCGAILCATNDIGFWPALLLIGGVYFLLYLAARLFAEVSSLGLIASIGLLGVLAAALLRLASYLSPVLLFALAACLGLAFSAAWFFILRPRRQQALWAQMGLCEKCGYDLRSSEDRCPECGAALPEELARRRRWRIQRKSPADPAPRSNPDRPA